ncbi:MAG: leucine-rich repeat domain-containing protein, partial [Chlamydiia bacterium]|nr:leucine-rich repeat domain-containing protein [Chlamydiia bacterium]
MMSPSFGTTNPLLLSILDFATPAAGADVSIRIVSKAWNEHCHILLLMHQKAQDAHPVYGKNWKLFCKLHPELPPHRRFYTFVCRMIFERPWKVSEYYDCWRLRNNQFYSTGDEIFNSTLDQLLKNVESLVGRRICEQWSENYLYTIGEYLKKPEGRDPFLQVTRFDAKWRCPPSDSNDIWPTSIGYRVDQLLIHEINWKYVSLHSDVEFSEGDIPHIREMEAEELKQFGHKLPVSLLVGESIQNPQKAMQRDLGNWKAFQIRELVFPAHCYGYQPSSMSICFQRLRFPETFELPVTLKNLYLQFCHIRELPVDLCKLTQLESFDLTGNTLS